MTESNDPASTPPPSPDPGAVPPPAAAPPPAAPMPVGYQAPANYGYPGPYTGPAPDPDSKMMGMLCHLLSILIGFLGPLIIWLIKKDQSPFVNDQGKEALNFQLTMLIGYVIGFVTACFLVGYLVILVVWVLTIVFGIMGAIAANKGEAYRYPFNIRMVK